MPRLFSRDQEVQVAHVSLATANDTSVVAAVALQRIIVWGYTIVAVAGRAQLHFGAVASISDILRVGGWHGATAEGGVAKTLWVPKVGPVNTVLNITTDDSCDDCQVWVEYTMAS